MSSNQLHQIENNHKMINQSLQKHTLTSEGQLNNFENMTAHSLKNSQINKLGIFQQFSNKKYLHKIIVLILVIVIFFCFTFQKKLSQNPKWQLPKKVTRYKLISATDPTACIRTHPVQVLWGHPCNMSSDQQYYFVRIQNQLQPTVQSTQTFKYKIISADTMKALIVNEQNSTNSQLTQNTFRFNSTTTYDINYVMNGSKKGQKMSKEEYKQLWQIKPIDFTAYNAFSIYNPATNIYLNASVLIDKLDTSVHHQKLITWVLWEVKNYTQNDTQVLQNKLALLLKNISYNLNPQLHYQEWLQFYDKRYQLSLLKEELPEWLTHQKKMILENDTNSLIKPYNKEQSKDKLQNDYKPNCAKKHTITYIWFGKKQMPPEYKNIIQTCKQSTKVLNFQHFLIYVEKWNKISSEEYQIIPNKVPTRQQINQLKLLYLYFQSGIYADFDTQINEECFQQVITDEIIFTNISLLQQLIFPIPQESFIMVRNSFNPQIKRMLQAQIKKNDRWQECRNRQCLIVNCQIHTRDNTYKKGYD